MNLFKAILQRIKQARRKALKRRELPYKWSRYSETVIALAITLVLVWCLFKSHPVVSTDRTYVIIGIIVSLLTAIILALSVYFRWWNKEDEDITVGGS